MVSNLISIEQLQTEMAPIIQRANAITVRNADDRSDAMEFTKAVKRGQETVTEYFKKSKSLTYASWKEVCRQESDLLDPLKAAEKRVKLTVTTYDDEEKDRRLAEQRRLQAEADERARKEREKLAREAAKLKTPELREERLEAAAAVTAPVVMVAAPEKQKGEASRQTWHMRLTDKVALIQEAANGNELAASLLEFNQSAGDQLARTIKGNVTIKGVAMYAKTSLSVRA